MSLRGSVCLYQGEELGLTEADLAFEDLQDPYGIRFWPEFKGRDGCRTPMVWDSQAPQWRLLDRPSPGCRCRPSTSGARGQRPAGRRRLGARALSPLPRLPPAASGLRQGRDRLPRTRGRRASPSRAARAMSRSSASSTSAPAGRRSTSAAERAATACRATAFRAGERPARSELGGCGAWFGRIA